MKQFLALMTSFLVLMLVITTIMAIGNTKQSEQIAQRTQLISSLRADLRKAEQQERQLNTALQAQQAAAGALRTERDALTKRYAGLLTLLRCQSTEYSDAAEIPGHSFLLPMGNPRRVDELPGESWLQAQAIQQLVNRLIAEQGGYTVRQETDRSPQETDEMPSTTEETDIFKVVKNQNSAQASSGTATAAKPREDASAGNTDPTPLVVYATVPAFHTTVSPAPSAVRLPVSTTACSSSDVPAPAATPRAILSTEQRMLPTVAQPVNTPSPDSVPAAVPAVLPSVAPTALPERAIPQVIKAAVKKELRTLSHFLLQIRQTMQHIIRLLSKPQQTIQ